MDELVGKTIKYEDGKDTYKVLHVGKMKVGAGFWLSAITYQSNTDGKIYTRDYPTYKSKFSVIESNEKEGS